MSASFTVARIVGVAPTRRRSHVVVARADAAIQLTFEDDSGSHGELGLVSSFELEPDEAEALAITLRVYARAARKETAP